MKNDPYINPDTLHSPCYHPLRNVWSVKIGYRKFEFTTLKCAQKFHIKYCERTNDIPKNEKHEVYCSDREPIGLSYNEKIINDNIEMLMGIKRNKKFILTDYKTKGTRSY
jgi:hypothetical protein